jgi:proline-specific peptidase
MSGITQGTHTTGAGTTIAPVLDEGFIEVPGGRVWYARLGSGDATPVLLLHGGPGAGHDYVAPLGEALAADRPVVMYDQLGCGRSEAPDDVSLWTVDRFVEELDAVRAALGLDRVHLLGQSWGGWLAIEYMTRGATGVERLVLASTSASSREFMDGARVLIEALPEPNRTVLLEDGARGAYDTPEYEAASMLFYRRHLCRMDPWPPALLATMDNLDGNQVYLTLNGPTEFDVIGPLRDWDRTADLGRIDVPTLVTVGRYDEIGPSCAETLRDGIPDARLTVFEHSAHVAHLEEPEAYADAVRGFLAT